MKIIAQKLGVSMYYMCHLFKQETGITIVDYKKEMRIIKAKNLLVNTDKKITDIAQECGFGGDSYFCKVFAEHELVSPSQYRDLYKKKLSILINELHFCTMSSKNSKSLGLEFFIQSEGLAWNHPQGVWNPSQCDGMASRVSVYPPSD